MKQGLVQVYTGEGKGKTTAALGLVLRAVGNGLRAYIVFFLKGDTVYGEQAALSKIPGVTVVRSGTGKFIHSRQITSEDKQQAKKALDAARKAMLGGDYDLVVLDEVNVAAAWNLIEVQDVISLIKEKPDNVELVLTGRYADKAVIDLADYVTVMVNIKHPFEKGIHARKGIEF
jgi:cob(I)alamin adenosyltransferase